MKYIKTYEMAKSDLKIGDYVLLDIDQLKKYCIESEQDFENYNLKDDRCKIIGIGESCDTEWEAKIRMPAAKYNI